MKENEQMKKPDVVYILKKDIEPYELTYSLRSLKNLPHGLVWFVGGEPKGLKPDRMIKHDQVGCDKWDLIRSSMWRVLQEPELSEEFYLFNDDFFVMKPFKGEFANFIDLELDDRIEELRQEFAWLKPYGRTLYKLNEELKILKKPRHNFEVHLPMLINKELMKASLYVCSSPQMRSAYGNLNEIDYKQHKDMKVYDKETVPDDPDFLSTNDTTFRDGAVGKYIRGVFDKPSKYEL